MVHKGYKAFNKNLTNRYGKQFEIGKTYTTTGKVIFGNNGNGFHFCTNVEDTLRYFDGVDDIDITEVTSTGDVDIYNDEYNGYYDMYSAQNITIDRIIERKELVEMFLTTITSEPRVFRFIQHYKLTEEEIKNINDIIYVEKYNKSGSVNAIRVGGNSIKGTEFRKLFN